MRSRRFELQREGTSKLLALGIFEGCWSLNLAVVEEQGRCGRPDSRPMGLRIDA